MQLVLLLSAVPGVGERTLGHLLLRNAALRCSPEELLALEPSVLVRDYQIRQEVAERIAKLSADQRCQAEEMARHMKRTGVQIVTFLDATYPMRLQRRMQAPPPVLYLFGNVSLLSRPFFAIANSNGASEEALACGDTVARMALDSGWTPVTGHNRKAYQRPALVARRSGKPVCYVLDRGLLEAFGGYWSRDLFAAARIWNPHYDPLCDLALSPFEMRAHMLAVHNRRRDDILFALADVIFVGEVRPGGHMEAVCLRARAQGVPVYLMTPGLLQNEKLKEAGAQPMNMQAVDSFAASLSCIEVESREDNA
jgi:predicted Rossmann fold nucleotide-binding protein DprA/Smf involved in DNA uptake